MERLFYKLWSFSWLSMPEYTLEEYGRRQSFVEAVDKSHTDVNDLFSKGEVLHQKRELLSMRYKNLIVEGGKRLPLSECNASRVCAALQHEYDVSNRFVDSFDDCRQLICRTNEVLSLEERALAEAARMPLFSQSTVSNAELQIRAYVTGLTPEQLKFVKAHLGHRIKQYLTKSGTSKCVETFK